MRDEMTVSRIETHAIVTDQQCLCDCAGAARENEIERKTRFAGAGRAANENGLCADTNGGGVNAGGRRRHVAGSRTTKRAPATRVSPSALEGPARFSAQIFPPCASMICLEIDRPSPEF